MTYADPRERSLDDLWSAVQNMPDTLPRSSFYGVLPHSGVGWQAIMVMWPVAGKGNINVHGKGTTPRTAIMDLIARVEAKWLAHPPHRYEWQQ